MEQLMLVGQHQFFRECLASRLGETDRFSICAQADDLNETRKHIRVDRPDVLLADLGTPDETKLASLQEITHHFPNVKVIVFGLPDDEAEILRCLEAGASGYVLMESSLDELIATIDQVLRGEAPCSPQILVSASDFDLTAREFEILELIAEGLSNQQIADALCLSLYTVKNHVHHILVKLEAEHRAAAVERAYGKRWLRARRRRPALSPADGFTPAQ